MIPKNEILLQHLSYFSAQQKVKHFEETNHRYVARPAIWV